MCYGGSGTERGRMGVRQARHSLEEYWGKEEKRVRKLDK